MYVSTAASATPLLRIMRNAKSARNAPGRRPARLIHGTSSQQTKKAWNAIVTTENARHAVACAATRFRLCRGERIVHPIAAAPTQLGTAKITHAQTPYSRTRSTGRNMPMTQVQEQARKAARRRSLNFEVGLGRAAASVTSETGMTKPESESNPKHE